MTVAGARIEMMLPSLPRAGMEMVAAALARGLRTRGHTVGFTCLDEVGDLGRELEDDGFRVAVVRARGLRTNLAAPDLLRWLRHVQPDIVHAHSGVWLKAAQNARLAGVRRVVLTLHGIPASQPWYLRHYHRLAATRADAVLAVSPSLQQHLIEDVGVPCDRVRLVLNGIPSHPPDRNSGDSNVRATLGIPAEAPVVGCVARLHPVKNHRLLVAAFARLRERLPDAYLLLVGDGAERAAVEAQVRDLGIEAAVRITGVVADPLAYLREMNVFVLASHIEGLSISLLEAMACDVPVVASAVGGTPFLLRDGALGRLVPPGDEAALCNAMHDALSVGVADIRVARARGVVLSDYSLERMLDAHEEAYGLTTNGRPPRAGT